MKVIDIISYFKSGEILPLLDVRTPAEFEKGHIPGAKNLPIFSNDERAEVGTLYKQVNPEAAVLRGLELAGAKMAWYVKQAQRLVRGKKVAIHCWRGGKRSGSMATLLSFVGYDVTLVKGGYKAYRNHVLSQFANRKLKIIVLGGKTGAGKTGILSCLADEGEQVIDLEGLAHHKGSAFGALGEIPQPTSEQFENDLYDIFREIDPSRRVWLENESRSIGRVFIPQGLWDQMCVADCILVDVPFEKRVERLIREYAHFDSEDLKESLQKVTRRMGGQNVKAALAAYNAGDIAEATAITLRYYDKTYEHAINQKSFTSLYRLPHAGDDCQTVARQLIKFANEHQR